MVNDPIDPHLNTNETAVPSEPKNTGGYKAQEQWKQFYYVIATKREVNQEAVDHHIRKVTYDVVATPAERIN
eukprot:scaffold39455_cov78-Skeletonema_dohrnii-CCMP3373.AAC.1